MRPSRIAAPPDDGRKGAHHTAVAAPHRRCKGCARPRFDRALVPARDAAYPAPMRARWYVAILASMLVGGLLAPIARADRDSAQAHYKKGMASYALEDWEGAIA